MNMHTCMLSDTLFIMHTIQYWFTHTMPVLSHACNMQLSHSRDTPSRQISFVPSCVVWPVASHPDWSACILSSCNETTPRREKDKANEELILTQRAFVLNSHSFWPRSTKMGPADVLCREALSGLLYKPPLLVHWRKIMWKKWSGFISVWRWFRASTE